MLPKKSLVLVGTICGVLSLFLIGGFLINSVFNKSGLSLTEAQKQSILAQIIKNNSSNLFGRNGLGAGENSTAAMAADSSKLLAPLGIWSGIRDYNYRNTTSTYATGPAVGKCKLFTGNDSGFYTTQSSEFYGDNNLYYSKYINTDKDKDLVSYSLTKTDNNNSQTISYQGGSYAVEWDYDFAALRASEVDPLNPVAVQEGPTTDVPISAPDAPNPPSDNVEPTIDYAALIEQYFGPDADIVNVINQNGKNYYVIQYSYDVDCSQDMKPLIYSVSNSAGTASTASQNKIIVQNYVASDTFEIVKNYNYLDSVSDSTLLNTYETTSETKNTTLDQVSNQFAFDYQAEIKKITYPTYDPASEAQTIIDYLAKQDLTLVLVSNADAKLQSVYSSPASLEKQASTNYLSDRNFYPTGAKGDVLYASYQTSLGLENMPVVTASYVFNADTTYDSVNIDVYNNNLNVDDLLKASSNTQLSKLSINIDGTNVEGTLYTFTYEALMENGSSPSSGASDSGVSSDAPDRTLVPPVAPTNYSTRQLYLEFQSKKYVIMLPSRNDYDLTTLKFKTIKTSNAGQMNEFGNAIKEAYTNGSIYGGGSSGVGVTVPSAKPL